MSYANIETMADIYQHYLVQIPIKYSVKINPTTFLRDTLFGLPGQFSINPTIGFDMESKNRLKLYGDNTLGDKGTKLNSDKSHTLDFYKFGYFAKNAPITNRLGETAIFGEDPAYPLTPMQRIMAGIADERDAQSAMADVYEESLCASVLNTFSVTTKNSGTNTYPVDPTCKKALSTRWSTNTSKPLTDIKDACDVVRKLSGVMCNTILMNMADVEYLTEKSTVLDQLDIQRFERGNINYMPMDGKYQVADSGYVKIPGYGPIRVLTYAGRYYDVATSTYADFIPAGTALLYNSSRPVGSMNYGPCENVQDSVPTYVTGRRLQTIGGTMNGAYASLELQMQTSPMPVPENLNSWFTLTNISA